MEDAIITNSKNIYQKCLRLRNHGSLKKYDHKFSGRNSRLEIQYDGSA